MTLQQFRSICEVVLNGYSVSRAASALHVSQPAVSKLVRSIEEELGGDVFVRSKGRMVGLTELGSDVYALASRILHDAASLSDMAAERYKEKSGVLRIATTHFHARYALLNVIEQFAPAYPEVDIELKQQDPQEIVDMVAAGECHLGLGTSPGKVPDSVLILPAYPIERCIITPLKHPLLEVKRVQLEDVAKYRLIAFEQVFTSGRAVQAQFKKRGLRPKIAIKTTDVDVIKAAVALGLGISIVQRMSIQPLVDKDLAVIDARHLFADAIAYISLRRGQYLRRFTYDFIERLAPQWGRKEIERKLKGR